MLKKLKFGLGIKYSELFRRSYWLFLWELIGKELWSAEGEYLWWMECMSEMHDASMICGNCMMLCLVNSGSVCSLYAE